VRFSVWPNTDLTFADLATVVQLSERLGYHATYLPDHFMPHDGEEGASNPDRLEATTTLAALASLTTSIRLGILVASATYRHPAVYAKSMCALDRISDGRAIVGMGAGWQENEHSAYGLHLGPVSERIDRFDEYVQVVSSMLSNAITTFDGRFFTLRDAPCDPRPVQEHVAILLGVRGRRRTMRLAARHATIWNAWATPETLRELGAVLDAHCEAEGRDASDVQRSVNAGLFLSEDEGWLAQFRQPGGSHPTLVGRPSEVLDTVGRYREAGCQELILPFDTDGSDRHLDMLELFQREVAVHFTT